MKTYPIATPNKTPLCNKEKYETMYAHSIDNSDEFWAQQATKFLHWDKKWTQVSNVDYAKGQIKWFEGGELNVAYNCIDRHLKDKGNKTI